MESKGRMSKFWFPWLIGMPCETTLAICSLVFGGVFERHPNLKIAFAHGGGSFPGTLGRIVHGFNVRPDLCAIKTKKNPLYVSVSFIIPPLFLSLSLSLISFHLISCHLNYNKLILFF